MVLQSSQTIDTYEKSHWMRGHAAAGAGVGRAPEVFLELLVFHPFEVALLAQVGKPVGLAQVADVVRLSVDQAAGVHILVAGPASIIRKSS